MFKCYICRVKFLKQISAIILGMIFLLSATGIVIFESYCLCSGNEEVSLFVTPETCETNYHEHHSCNSEGIEMFANAHDYHECTSHTYDCGCSTPEVKYIKLINPLIDEAVGFVKVQPIKIFVSETVMNSILADVFTFIESEEFYIDPPKKINTSLEFLVQINQLKIPVLA